MEYLPIILLGVTIALVVILIFTSKKNQKKATDNHSVSLVSSDDALAIPIELLPATIEIDEKSLHKITDNTVIARISQVVPAIAQTATRTVANNDLKNMEVYRAILPAGQTLTKSKDMAGAVRGFYSGAKGIKGQANLIKVNLSKTTAVADGVANIMNVGSLVVGQYYMAEINSKLEEMNTSINKISDFQDREFKSRILSLISRVEEISGFNTEIMENDELRNIKLAVLEDLKGDASELLSQVNLTIDDISQKNTNPDYQEYQKIVDEFCILVNYRNILLAFLEKISKLTYLFGKSGISNDMCYSLFHKFYEQSIQVASALEQWHDRQVTTLRIDLDKNRISKTGFDRIISAIPSVLDDKWNYKELESGLIQKISTQTKAEPVALSRPKDVYDEDVEIIIKDGDYYYRKAAS